MCCWEYAWDLALAAHTCRLTFTSIVHNPAGCYDLAYENITVKTEAAGAVVPYEYSMHFSGMNYADLIADPVKTLQFKQGIRQRVSLAVGLPFGNVEVRAGTCHVCAAATALWAGELYDGTALFR